jgi:DNA primase
MAQLVERLWPDVKVVSGGSEFMVPCPFCGTDKQKCAVNPDKGVFQCWVCGERGPTSKFLYHLKDIGAIKKRDIDAVLIGKDKSPTLSDLEPVVKPKEKPQDHLWTPEQPCVFPTGVRPLYGNPEPWANKMAQKLYARAYDYLEGRGVTRKDIHRYRLHFCYHLGSPYHGHIFIPCLGRFGRELTFWTTRSILPNPQTKSFHSSSRYTRYSAKVSMINEHLVVGTTIALCEGPFDAWSIMKHTGIPAVPLLGKNLHKYHRSVIKEREIEKVYICLDADAKASMASMGAGLPARYVYLEDGDPNDVSPETLKAAFENAASVSVPEWPIPFCQ